MNQQSVFSLTGLIVDLVHDTQFTGKITIENGIITEIKRLATTASHVITPGFIDAHVHIESSLVPPREFARLAVRHGTVAAVIDPHEIANVLGVVGIEYMISNAQGTPFKFYCGAPSCVPATIFETSGAQLDSIVTCQLLARKDIYFLAEVMNYPAVINRDPEIIAKIQCAHRQHKPVDGHAPGLQGEALKQYCQAGITTDHETTNYNEAVEKIQNNMRILIREGSAAQNFEKLYRLIDNYPDYCMFCSDDKHINDLMRGHINLLVQRALAKNCNFMNVLRCASLNPIRHYKLPVGLLQEGDPADFLVLDNNNINKGNIPVLATYIQGQCVAAQNTSFIEYKPSVIVNNFQATVCTEQSLQVVPQPGLLRVIKAHEGQITTTQTLVEAQVDQHAQNVISDVNRDILKLVVLSRYSMQSKPAVGFVKNFGLKRGALASSIAHDSHNIIGVGATDKELCAAINSIIEHKGGICVTLDGFTKVLKLPIAGLMSPEPAEYVAQDYKVLTQFAQEELGCTLQEPFMTLSFMALLVIPELKLSDLGLFDSKHFNFVSLWVDML